MGCTTLLGFLNNTNIIWLAKVTNKLSASDQLYNKLKRFYIPLILLSLANCNSDWDASGALKTKSHCNHMDVDAKKLSRCSWSTEPFILSNSACSTYIVRALEEFVPSKPTVRLLAKTYKLSIFLIFFNIR